MRSQSGPTCPSPRKSRACSKKWIPRSEDWTFWSTTPGYSALAPSEITEESFHAHYNINVFGVILTVQAAIKRFGCRRREHHQPQLHRRLTSRGGSLAVRVHQRCHRNVNQGIGSRTGSAQDPRQRHRSRSYRNRRQRGCGDLRWWCRRGSSCEDAAWPARSHHGYSPSGCIPGIRRIGLDHRRSHSGRRRPGCGHLSAVCSFVSTGYRSVVRF